MKVISLSEACSRIPDDATVASVGFGGIGLPEYLFRGIEQRFLETQHPRGLTWIHAAGQSDLNGGGVDHLAHEGLLKRIIGGHYRLAPAIGKLIRDEKVEAYNFPQGVIAQLYREIAARRPGLTTHAGLGTFVDPRMEGGRMNARTTEELVQVVNMLDREWLFYKALPINVGVLRMTVADPFGNLAGDREACKLESLPAALAAHNHGGIVIAQVESLLEKPLTPHEVVVPGLYVDYVVVAPPEFHWQTAECEFNPLYIREETTDAPDIPLMPLCDRKIIARRAAMELFEGAVVNLGIGMPEGVAAVAYEEGVFDQITLTVESGTIGGVPASNLSFGAAANPIAFVAHQDQFDFYSGGGLDIAFLGMAEFDAAGNVNVSRFGDIVAGCGGFIEISQNSREVVFCGTLTASGLQLNIGDGKLVIAQEGKVKKAKSAVRQITFSGAEAVRRGLPVKYVTERCVFELRGDGVTLVEVAPGISVEEDIVAQMQFRPQIAKDLRTMPACIFADAPLGLKLRRD